MQNFVSGWAPVAEIQVLAKKLQIGHSMSLLRAL